MANHSDPGSKPSLTGITVVASMIARVGRAQFTPLCNEGAVAKVATITAASYQPISPEMLDLFVELEVGIDGSAQR